MHVLARVYVSTNARTWRRSVAIHNTSGNNVWPRHRLRARHEMIDFRFSPPDQLSLIISHAYRTHAPRVIYIIIMSRRRRVIDSGGNDCAAVVDGVRRPIYIYIFMYQMLSIVRRNQSISSFLVRIRSTCDSPSEFFIHGVWREHTYTHTFLNNYF